MGSLGRPDPRRSKMVGGVSDDPNPDLISLPLDPKKHRLPAEFGCEPMMAANFVFR